MNGAGRFEDLFAAIDRADVDGFMAWLDDDCSFTYGSGEPVRGATAIRQVVGAFFDTFEALAHRVDASWEVDGTAITEGVVTYTTSDGRRTAVPFCNVLHMADDGRIREYRVYIDPTPLATND
ncbi:MAG: nuclear transport factor 2 family protein [Holophagae bacterium]|jgi:ketosteroid isomerase-like protein